MTFAAQSGAYIFAASQTVIGEAISGAKCHKASASHQRRWSGRTPSERFFSPPCMQITYRPPKLSAVIGQRVRKASLSFPPLSSTLYCFTHSLEFLCETKATKTERWHRGLCRQLSVLLESDQAGVAWLLHYILAQSKIVWPGTALPLGAQSVTTHRLNCTNSNRFVFRSLLNSPSLRVHVFVGETVSGRGAKRRDVSEMRGNVTAGSPQFLKIGCNRPIME